MARERTAGRARSSTVIACGTRRQRSTLIDIPQLSEADLCAVIRHGSPANATLAWHERKARADRVRKFMEIDLPWIKARAALQSTANHD